MDILEAKVVVHNGASQKETFEQWWSIYPRKLKKPRALRAWKQVEPERTSVIRGTGRWVRHWRVEGTPRTFIPHPATFLRDRQWEDSPDGRTDEREPDGEESGSGLIRRL